MTGIEFIIRATKHLLKTDHEAVNPVSLLIPGYYLLINKVHEKGHFSKPRLLETLQFPFGTLTSRA